MCIYKAIKNIRKALRKSGSTETALKLEEEERLNYMGCEKFSPLKVFTIKYDLKNNR